VSEADAHIVDLARMGDEQAYLTLVRRYKGIVASKVYSVIPDLGVVDEICEDAFAKAWCKLGELRNAAAFGGWVRRIAHRLALGRLRAAARERQRRGGAGAVAVAAGGSGARARAPVIRDVAEVPAGPGSDPSERVAIRQLYERIALEISRLPRAYRDAMGMRYFDGLSCKEIAATLGLPIGTVTMQLSRGTRMLRGRLRTALKDYLEA
jgi:RNA polymerase sigma-70 factor (ECF subfamily)